jgi:3-hydroxybutyryl-CoA dehydrogenase
MIYTIEQDGESRSFPAGDAFLAGAGAGAQADIVVHLGTRVALDDGKKAVLVELGSECLADHAADDDPAHANVLGFARFRNGSDAPSALVELVRMRVTADAAVAAAKALFESAGLSVVVCNDQAGRILDRLVRPKYNAALRFLDEGLASAADMDLTCKLGLGYPDGPIERIVRGGLVHHCDVTSALFATYGTPAFAPPRMALAARRRGDG